MKSIVFLSGFILATGVSTPVWAQENWSGPYFGAYADVSNDETGFEDFGCWTACTKVTVQGNQVGGGFTAGYDIQVADSFVVGAVGDIGTGHNRSLVAGAGLPTSSVGTITFRSDVSRQSSIRARAGLASGRTLLYVTGGIGLAKGKYSAEGRGLPVFNPAHSANFAAAWSGTTSGPIVGAGVEFQFAAFSAKAEVLNTRFQTTSACFANLDGPNAGVCWTTAYGIPPQLNTTSSQTSIRVGLNYRF